MYLPDFSFEKKLRAQGYKYIAGLDEVGRGSFAGPVVAAAVAFAPNVNFQFRIINEFSNKVVVNDSKKLNQKQREIADIWIRENALCFGIGTASVSQINKFGIKKAAEIAFRKAIKEAGNTNGLPHTIDHLLVDAFYIPHVPGFGRKKQLSIIKGDSLSFSIAAASIIAKVYRDKLMAKLSVNSKYGQYEWHKNKGYGTKKHRLYIQKYGITKLHRTKFVEKTLAKS